MKYELRLTLNDNYIILETGNKEYCELMLKWYQAHKKFFNGTFSIKEVK